MSTLYFNLRMDPFESFGSTGSCGHLLQKVSWLIQPMSVLTNQPSHTLEAYPPVQGGTSFDMSAHHPLSGLLLHRHTGLDSNRR